MARNENLPFPLGTTYFAGQTPDVAVATNLEGQEYEVEDYASLSTIGSSDYRSNRRRVVRAVRNMNASAVHAGNVAKLKVDGSTAGVIVGQVDGLCATAADRGFPVDEFLDTAGCAQYDIVWVVVQGLATVKTASTGTTTVAVGGKVVSGGGGGVVAQDTSTTGADLFNQIQNCLGVAATAVNQASTNFVLDVGATKC